MDRTIVLIVGAIGGAIALAVAMIIVSAFRPLSTLETALWQLISLAAGLYGSYLLGQRAARESAMDLLRLHSRLCRAPAHGDPGKFTPALRQALKNSSTKKETLAWK